MNILVTGGAGYIGSHVVKELLNKGYFPITYDNLSSGHKEAVLGGKFIKGDLCDEKRLRESFRNYSIDAVMHFAASCYVGESVKNPQKYYYDNLVNGLNLLKVMLEFNIKKFVFSSSAAVYGEPREIPIVENHPLNPINPYGKTKVSFENILVDYSRAYGIKYISLRYFNAAGADPEGKIGEDHNPETHLIPLVLQVALAERSSFKEEGSGFRAPVSGLKEGNSVHRTPKVEPLKIFGTDYPTSDGTCIRDYTHVADLANAHILALEALNDETENRIFNLGKGEGHSVKEVIEAARKVTGKRIAAIEVERRPGDPAALVASSENIKRELGWKPEFSELDKIIETAWKWQIKKDKLLWNGDR
jgi:UDP-glucose 4-epimerase